MHLHPYHQKKLKPHGSRKYTAAMVSAWHKDLKTMKQCELARKLGIRASVLGRLLVQEANGELP